MNPCSGRASTKKKVGKKESAVVLVVELI